MSFWEVLSIAWRRWYVTLAGVALTAIALLLVSNAASVYYAQVRVVMLAPPGALPNAYQRTLASLTEFTGAVVRSLQGEGQASSVSEGVTLVGEGRTEGYLVRQPNAGGQWQYSFEDPYVDVQAVGPTAQEAQRQIDIAVGAVEAAVEELQSEQGVDPAIMIRTELAPEVPQIYLQEGSRVRAMAMTGAIGAIVTFFTLLLLGPPRRRGGAAERNGADAPSSRPRQDRVPAMSRVS